VRQGRGRLPQTCGQMELAPPPLRDVLRDLSEARFECVFEQWQGCNLYSLNIRLSDGAQVLVVAAGRVGIQPTEYGGMPAEVFTVEAMTPLYLAAAAEGARDRFAAAGPQGAER
jgi:hypothetical protein